jgi:hypothetical protein
VLLAKDEREWWSALPAVVGDAEEACAIAELVPNYGGKTCGLCGKRSGCCSGSEKQPAGALVVAAMSGVGQDGEEKLRDGIRMRSIVSEGLQDSESSTVVAAQHRPDAILRGRLRQRWRCEQRECTHESRHPGHRYL